MNDIDISEPSRTATDIQLTNNPLGMAVAQFVLMFNDAPERYSIMVDKVILKAQIVENDTDFGDHVRLYGTHEAGYNIGGDTTRFVVINTVPKGATAFSTRFVNFNRVEGNPNYHIGQINSLVQDVIAWVVGVDVEFN